MTEIEKLEKRMKEEGFSIRGITPGPELYKLPVEERAEALAREINRVHEELSDPVKNLISRVNGHIFLLEDSILCTENKFDCTTLEYVEPSDKEKRQIRRDKEMVDILTECVNMIKELNDRVA